MVCGDGLKHGFNNCVGEGMGTVIVWEKEWVQYFMVLFVVVAIFLTLLSKGVLVGAMVMLLCGFVAGRWWYLKRYTEQILPYVLIFLGFMIGILIGSFWSSRILNLVSFVVGLYVSYMLHRKEVITFKSQNFVK